MAIFRTRSPQRDRDADRRRLGNLVTLLRTMNDEMKAERDGLQARRARTEEMAAFSVLAFEEDGGTRMSASLNDLSSSIVAATDRLKSLDRQIAFTARLLEEATAFSNAVLAKPER